MNDDLDGFVFACPCCGEPNEVLPDPDERGQLIVQDCRVCCRPIEIHVPLDASQPPRIEAEDQ